MSANCNTKISINRQTNSEVGDRVYENEYGELKVEKRKPEYSRTSMENQTNTDDQTNTGDQTNTDDQANTENQVKIVERR